MQHLAVMKKFILSTCADWDEDAMPDAWEQAMFGGTGIVGADTDYDHDGFPDAHEYLAGTQPTNGASGLFLKEPLAWAGNIHLVRWDSVAGKRYRVVRSTNLWHGFTAIGGGIAATAAGNVYTDYLPPDATLIYGVGLEP